MPTDMPSSFDFFQSSTRPTRVVSQLRYFRCADWQSASWLSNLSDIFFFPSSCSNTYSTHGRTVIGLQLLIAWASSFFKSRNPFTSFPLTWPFSFVDKWVKKNSERYVIGYRCYTWMILKVLFSEQNSSRTFTSVSFVWSSYAFFSFKYWRQIFNADFVAVLVLFASLSSRGRFKSSCDNVAPLQNWPNCWLVC